VAGTAGAPATFTSFKDNTVGGDSTGDPSSKGTPAGKGGDYGTSIAASEDTTVSITHAVFRDGLFAVDPSGVEPTAPVRSITISHSSFATELALGDYEQVQPTYAITLTNNTWHFDGAPSGQYSLGGPYDPKAEQPAVLLYNVDPAGVCLDGSCANKFTVVAIPMTFNTTP
jgi:hypothetical protein